MTTPLKTPQRWLQHSVFDEIAPLAKLVWLFIALEGEGVYSARDLERHLGVSHLAAHRGVVTLLRLGLLREVVPASGSRGATLRAVAPTATTGAKTDTV